MIVQLEKTCKVWLFAMIIIIIMITMCVFCNLLLFIYYIGLFWKGQGVLVILLYVNLKVVFYKNKHTLWEMQEPSEPFCAEGHIYFKKDFQKYVKS